MPGIPQDIQAELVKRHRGSMITVLAFLGLNLVLLVIAYTAGEHICRPFDLKLAMGLWIAILVCGLGVFVLRRTRFSIMRLKDLTAVKGPSALLKTLQGTTVQIAAIGGAIALMGFMAAIIRCDRADMLRAAGVSTIVLIYCFPFRSAWERTVRQLMPPAE